MLPKESADDKEKEVKRKKRQMKLEADTDSSLKVYFFTSLNCFFIELVSICSRKLS